MATIKRRRRLSSRQVDELFRLARYYILEARRCAKAKAYLAGSIMQASSFECILIAMCDLYYQEAIKTQTAQKKKLANRPLLKWSSADLLAVAREAKWTPAAKIGNHLRRVHKLRNLVHPARYLQDHHGKRITKAYYDGAEKVGDTARNWIAYQDSLRATAKLAKRKRQPKTTP